MSRLVEARITEIVTSIALVLLDDNGHIINIEEVIEEESRADAEVEEILEEVRKDTPLKDHREVE